MRTGIVIGAFAFWIAAWAANEWLVRQNPSNPLLGGCPGLRCPCFSA